MLCRRSLMAGGLALAAAPALTRIAQAQTDKEAAKAMLVFVGHAL